MRYRSARSQNTYVSFRDALFQGLAPDGGLFVPKSMPKLSHEQLDRIKHGVIEEIGAEILSLFIDDIPKNVLIKIVKQGLSFPLPIRSLDDRRILELSHGPTMAFKDVAAQILPRLMEQYLLGNDQHTLILTATSGDTGGAVAHGFSGKKHISVAILFPKGKVSTLQRDQLTHVGRNICPIEVEGTFDDCQTIVKHAFSDPDLQIYGLTSANSINIGRLLPQMIYYAYTWSQLTDDNLTFVVPSGNMGNVTAGLYAKMIGIPIQKLVIACNANDPVVTYFETGIYRDKPSKQTLSTAMDIGHPSNFERILDLLEGDYNRFKQLFTATRTTDEETIQTIKDVFDTYHILLDPHTAVAWNAADKLKLKSPVIIQTADSVKFADEIHRATGIRLPDKKSVSFPAKQTVYPSDNTYNSVKQIIEGFLKE